MSRSREGFWTVVGSLGTVAALIVTLVSLQRDSESQEEPLDPETTSGSGGFYDEPGEAVGTEFDDGGEALGWKQDGDSFTAWLAPTLQDGACRSQAFDLDDGGTYSWYRTETDYPESAELSWQSCGDDTPGYLYGRWAWSTRVASEGAQDPAACEAAITDESYLEFVLDPDDPTADEGCLYTSDGRLATVAFDYIGSYGDTVDAHLAVTLWTWN
jgi:hypothetical protein